MFKELLDQTPTIETLSPKIWETATSVKFTLHNTAQCMLLLFSKLLSYFNDVLLWTPTYGCAKAGRPARTYIQQLCEDTGCNPEDLPEAMNDREKWRERVRDIRAGGTTWWWSLTIFGLLSSYSQRFGQCVLKVFLDKLGSPYGTSNWTLFNP